MLPADLRPEHPTQTSSFPGDVLSDPVNGESLIGSADLFPFQVVDNQISFSDQDRRDIHRVFPAENYPSLWSLIEEISVPAFRLPEAWSECSLSLKHDMIQMAFTLAALLDAKEQELASQEPSHLFLPADANQEANLAYLEHYAQYQLATAEPLPDFPIKVQMFYQLAKMGLADPDTRCYPSWDITCIASRIVQLIKQARNPWISTARRSDFAYTGIPRNSDAAPRYNPDIPRNVSSFFGKVIALKKEYPLWFPKEVKNTPPLFKNIRTFSRFFFEVMPQLLVSAYDHPRSFFKIFPQDKQVFSANFVIDLETYSGLGPSMTLEMFTGYTHRGLNGKEASGITRTDYFPGFNLLFANPESASVLARIFSLPLTSNNQLLAPQLITLLGKLRSPGLSLEVMVNPDGSVAFVVDAIPVKKGLSPYIAPQEFFDLLGKSFVIDPRQYPSALADLASNEQHMRILAAAEAGIDLDHRPIDDFYKGSSIPTIRYELRPTWRELAMADRKSSILGLSGGNRLSDFL